ncbi:hypothetical protein AA313_de0208357 [Arthrobotrys entomopaga]|nr:hypothetical protein AA313_de0208357 [Arthrobotrys entomopaga]
MNFPPGKCKCPHHHPMAFAIAYQCYSIDSSNTHARIICTMRWPSCILYSPQKPSRGRPIFPLHITLGKGREKKSRFISGEYVFRDPIRCRENILNILFIVVQLS